MRRVLISILLLVITGPLAGQDLRLPMKDGSVKFAVIGDTGTGGPDQVAVSKEIVAYRSKFGFDFVIMMGDNLYGGQGPKDFARKFEQPYKALLDVGVKFYAALGNHDDPNQRMYKQFNMNGERYYTFKPSLTANVRFFALDSNYMDPMQLTWFEKELAASGSDWKIAFFHHPPYASGMHGSDEILKKQLEPLFVKYGVNVVFTGHEHFYERIRPQKGVQYFVEGSSAKLRRGDINTTGLTAFGYDQGYTFMLIEVAGDELYFQTITSRGQTIDSGIVKKGIDNRVVGTGGRGEPTPAQIGPRAKPTQNGPPIKPAQVGPAPKPGTTNPKPQNPNPK
jgi:predicted MPP superfamily phosphohydrolase